MDSSQNSMFHDKTDNELLLAFPNSDTIRTLNLPQRQSYSSRGSRPRRASDRSRQVSGNPGLRDSLPTMQASSPTLPLPPPPSSFPPPLPSPQQQQASPLFSPFSSTLSELHHPLAARYSSHRLHMGPMPMAISPYSDLSLQRPFSDLALVMHPLFQAPRPVLMNNSSNSSTPPLASTPLHSHQLTKLTPSTELNTPSSGSIWDGLDTMDNDYDAFSNEGSDNGSSLIMSAAAAAAGPGSNDSRTAPSLGSRNRSRNRERPTVPIAQWDEIQRKREEEEEESKLRRRIKNKRRKEEEAEARRKSALQSSSSSDPIPEVQKNELSWDLLAKEVDKDLPEGKWSGWGELKFKSSPHAASSLDDTTITTTTTTISRPTKPEPTEVKHFNSGRQVALYLVKQLHDVRKHPAYLGDYEAIFTNIGEGKEPDGMYIANICDSGPEDSSFTVVCTRELSIAGQFLWYRNFAANNRKNVCAVVYLTCTKIMQCDPLVPLSNFDTLAKTVVDDDEFTLTNGVSMHLHREREYVHIRNEAEDNECIRVQYKDGSIEYYVFTTGPCQQTDLGRCILTEQWVNVNKIIHDNLIPSLYYNKPDYPYPIKVYFPNFSDVQGSEYFRKEDIRISTKTMLMFDRAMDTELPFKPPYYLKIDPKIKPQIRNAVKERDWRKVYNICLTILHGEDYYEKLALKHKGPSMKWIN